MKPKTSLIIFTIAVILFSLAACAGASTGDAGKVAEAFWQALVDKNDATLSSLSCVAYEQEALTTLESFRAVEVRLEVVTCSATPIDDATASVACQGKVVASYGAEDLEIDLSRRTYRAVKEGGDWRMCGEE